jgi:hypothetical protein
MTKYAQRKEQVFTDWAAPVRPVPLTGDMGQVQLAHPTWQHRSDRSGPVRAQSNKSVCYLVQGDQARVASRLRSLCSI